MEKMIKILSEVMDIDLNLEDLNRPLTDFDEWDSISIIGLMAKLDEDFKVEINPEEFESIKTLRELVILLGSKLQ
jgi:acyl carrier protein